MNIWVVSMEYAGISEAGGVKNVACSLSESLADSGCDVTVFLPRFGCTNMEKIKDVAECDLNAVVSICGKNEKVTYKTGTIKNESASNTDSDKNIDKSSDKNLRTVLVEHNCFLEKNDIYTYTQEDENKNSIHKKGNGFFDARFLETLFAKSVAFFHLNRPDIILCHDAATALVPAFVAMDNSDFFSKTKCVVVIHNAGPAYHHEFSSLEQAKYYTVLPEKILLASQNGERVEPFLLACESGAFLATVSEQYAKDLTDNLHGKITDGLSDLFFEKKISVTGITNGIDFESYNPEAKEKSLLPFSYSTINGDLEGKRECRKFFIEKFASENCSEKEKKYDDYMHGLFKSGFIKNDADDVFFAYHGRLVSQKGIDVLVDAAKIVLEKNSYARFAIMGQGEEALENASRELAEKYPCRVVYFKGYNKYMARLVIAACDYILMPSKFEPCGLEDFIAQIFGTLPVAHATGGLKKIIDGFDGFLYSPNDAQTLAEKIEELVAFKHGQQQKFEKMICDAANYVKAEYNWRDIAQKKYLPFFESILNHK